MLDIYLATVQRFIHDQDQKLIDPGDLIHYINRARREVAMRASCIRRLTPITGSIISGQVLAGGSGYTNPVVVISPPDFPSGTLPFPNGLQAVATASVLNGAIDSINVQVGGYGYFQPLVTIQDPTGHGASVSVNISSFNQVAAGQESYPFSQVDLSVFPGVKAIYCVNSITIIFSNYRYSLPVYAFSTYQARVRQYPFQYQDVPTIATQFGQGTDGSLYVYPLPNQTYQMEWDALCLPSDLIGFTDYEAIPDPWTDAVGYYAAYLAFLELQNANSARMHLELFDMHMKRFSTYARPGRVSNPYGRF